MEQEPMKRAFVLALFTMLAGPAPAKAGELEELVRGLYRPYERDAAAPSALRLLRPHPSKRLRALIAKEERCTAKSREICNLDFDVIINGQDWELKNLRIEPAKLEADRASVVARFINIDTPQRIVYKFVRESSRWRLEDVESLVPEADRWSLSRILARP
jgi:hypothetical protein